MRANLTTKSIVSLTRARSPPTPTITDLALCTRACLDAWTNWFPSQRYQYPPVLIPTPHREITARINSDGDCRDELITVDDSFKKPKAATRRSFSLLVFLFCSLSPGFSMPVVTCKHFSTTHFFFLFHLFFPTVRFPLKISPVSPLLLFTHHIPPKAYPAHGKAR